MRAVQKGFQNRDRKGAAHANYRNLVLAVQAERTFGHFVAGVARLAQDARLLQDQSQ